MLDVQILRFCDETSRAAFVTAMRDVLKAGDKPLLMHDGRTREILAKAVTKARRQEILAAFFRSVFTEVSLRNLYLKEIFVRKYSITNF